METSEGPPIRVRVRVRVKIRVRVRVSRKMYPGLRNGLPSGVGILENFM